MEAADIAVFSRNHASYLDQAATIGTRDPNQSVVFRARKRWVSAERAVGAIGALPIYFAPVGGTGDVEYVAVLCGVLLDPVEGSEETAKWLLRAAPGTSDEGLWNPPARTLYEIRSCRKLERPFPFTRLVKTSDGKRLSADYGYSYSMVRALPDVP